MIGLIFGDTDFPKEILKTIKRKRINYLIIDLSKNKIFKKNKRSYSVAIGQFGKIINILKKNNCKKVLFAGKVNKPKFSKLKLDFKGIYYIPRIIKASKLGDAAILKEIIKILSQNKIKTENSLKFNPELSLKKGNYSKIKPNKEDQLDINKAIKILNSLRQYNFSQGVVVRDNKVVAIEGKGGTKNMLKQSINKKIKNFSLNKNLIDFIEWFAAYNMMPLGLVLKMSIGNNLNSIEKKDENFTHVIVLRSFLLRAARCNGRP